MSGFDVWMPSDSDEDVFGHAKAACPQEHQEAACPPEQQAVSKAEIGQKEQSTKMRRQSVTKVAKHVPQTKKVGSALKDKGQKARKLMRCGSSPPSLIVEEMIGLRGPPLKQPVVVFPVKTTGDGRRWMPINAHQLWLRRVCHPVGHTHFRMVFQAAASSLRATLMEKMAKSKMEAARNKAHRVLHRLEQEEDDGASPEAAAASPQTAAASSQRAAASPEAAAPKNAGMSSNMGEPVKVCLGDTMVTVKFTWNVVLMECTCDAVRAIVDYCKKAIAKDQSYARQQSHADVGDGKGFQMRALSCTPIVGKVTWQPSLRSWSVHYKKEGGRVVQHKCRVSVRTAYASMGIGERQKDAFEKERRRQYIEALEYWNEHDTSSRDRIVVADY